MYSKRLQGRQIRLLVVQGCQDFAADIECRLVVRELPNRKRRGKRKRELIYRALSYVWGDPSCRLGQIVVGGTRIGITRKLEQVLRRLRAHGGGESITLWVDAVCINQDDAKERADQVALMDQIYTSCSEVCIWLGPLGCEEVPRCLSRDGLSSGAPDAEPAGSPEAQGLVYCARNLVSLASGRDVHFKDLAPRAPGTPAGTARAMTMVMKELAASPWFTRAWVVQEAMLAPAATVYFGNVCLSRETLWDALTKRRQLEDTCICCVESEGSKDDGPKLAQAMRTFYTNLASLAVIRDPTGREGKLDTPTSPAMALLEYTASKRAQNCYDPRDRIYAYQGVVRQWLGRRKTKKPDYENTEAPDLYLRVCSDAVTGTRGELQFLAWDTTKNRYKDQLPSWVLDWTHGGDTTEVRFYDESKRWDGAKGIPKRAKIVGGTVLASAGRRIDRIAKVGVPFRDAEHVYRDWHVITGLREQGAPERSYPSGGSWDDAWWGLLCFDAANASSKRTERDIRAFELGNSVFEPARFNYLPVGRVSLACQRMGFDTSSPEAFFDLYKTTIKPLLGEVLLMLDGNVIFVTERGYMGLARPGAQPGDGVFLLGGCTVPLILRETTKTATTKDELDGKPLGGTALRELISASFVYGIMDGQLEHGGPETEIVCLF